MNEVKIQIPDNCELIKDGDTYIVKEKKQTPPRSWKEFCEKYPLQEEAYIDSYSNIKSVVFDLNRERDKVTGKNWCTSKEEAEAFLALMQLRQLRKARIGDWECTESGNSYGIIVRKDKPFEIRVFNTIYGNMIFPNREMAEDFLSCFKDLCETAKMLL